MKFVARVSPPRDPDAPEDSRATTIAAALLFYQGAAGRHGNAHRGKRHSPVRRPATAVGHRALVRQSPILILDEPTSALDAISQAYVQQTTRELIARRAATVVIVGHRFSTILQTDFIVVLDRGVIREVWLHEELAARRAVRQSPTASAVGGNSG